MRPLNDKEVKLFQSDLYPLRIFLEQNGLYLPNIKNIFEATTFQIESKQELKGARGITYEDNKIGILDELVLDNYQRARTIYHELTHVMFKNDRYTDENLNNIIQLKNNNPAELPLGLEVYAQGLRCLEEYLAETFSLMACTYAKRINTPKKVSLLTPGICGKYAYQSNFGSNYGIFQTTCEKIIERLFGSNENAVKAAFNGQYYSSFFATNDNVEMMKLLGNLGQIYGAIQTYAGYERPCISEYSPSNIEQLLYETNLKTNSISRQVQTQNIGRNHR